MIATMFLGHYHKHDWWGFVRIYCGFLAWQALVVTGGDFQNPLDSYILGDYWDANRAVMILLVEAFFFCWIGFAFHKVLSNIQLFQLTEKFPFPLRSQARPALLLKPDGTHVVRNIVHDRNAPDRNFGVVGLTQSWFQALVTLVVFLGGIVAPQAAYDQLFDTEWRTGLEKTVAYPIVVVTPFASLCLFCFFCLYVYTDPGTWGLTRDWLLANADKYPLPETDIELIDRDTRSRIKWSILPIAAFALFGNFAIGGMRLINNNVDVMWLTGVGLWALYGIILLAIAIFRRPDVNPFTPMKWTKLFNDGGDYVEQMASRASDTAIEMSGLAKNGYALAHVSL
jgi:hypothetical protein